MDTLLDYIGDIYEASFDPGRWDSVIATLCQLLSARSAAIFMDDHENNVRAVVGSHGIPAAVTLAYRFGLSKHDYTFQLQKNVMDGQALQLIDAREMKETNPFYYHLLLKPNDIGFLGTLGIYNNAEWQIGIGIHRSFESVPFSDSDLGTLKLLYPHFRRSLRIHREFHKLRSRQQTLESALERLMLGLVVVRADGTVEYCNPVAKALLKQHQGLQLTPQKRVKAHFPDENHQLQDALARLLSADSQDVFVRSPIALGLHHPNREHAINVMLTAASPLENHDPLPRVTLYLSDPDSSFSLSTEVLHSLYGMTAAEAAVSIALVNGQSPEQISKKNGVSIETVRSQLKSIYAKMGVNRQQDVIRLLLSGVTLRW